MKDKSLYCLFEANYHYHKVKGATYHHFSVLRSHLKEFNDSIPYIYSFAKSIARAITAVFILSFVSFSVKSGSVFPVLFALFVFSLTVPATRVTKLRKIVNSYNTKSIPETISNLKLIAIRFSAIHFNIRYRIINQTKVVFLPFIVFGRLATKYNLLKPWHTTCTQ